MLVAGPVPYGHAHIAELDAYDLIMYVVYTSFVH